MAAKKLEFKNTEGIQLSARLELPIDQNPVAYALFAHCFTCNKNLRPIKNICQALTRHGFGVLRFDFTGVGESEGDFVNTNFSSNIEDLVAAAKFMEENLKGPKLLVGHSMGGAAVIFAGKYIPSLQAVATIAAPSSPKHIEHLFKHKIEDIKSNKPVKIEIHGRTFTIKKQFLDDISDKNMQEAVEELDKSLLILHSPQDKVVGIANAATIYEFAKHPKSFVSLDGADHLLSEEKDSRYVGDVIGTWAKRYVEIPQEKLLKPKKKVMVQIGCEGYTTEVKVGKHNFRADEPEEVGGNDFGPTPYDLLLASLGSCTAITMRMYADRKQWKIDEINIHLQHSKVYNEDCTNCEENNAKIDLIERVIEIKGNVDGAQIKRLLEIADKCPVHKTLHSKIEVKTSLIA